MVKKDGDIRAEGLRAAAALVERLVRLVDGDAPASVGMDAVEPWVDLWSDLVERTTDTVQRLRSGTDLAPIPPLAITVGPDARGEAEMWLHNGTSSDQGELVPRCGPLTSVDGYALDCEVAIEPPKIDRLHARSSRGFAISVTLGPESPVGTYRGIVQVAGADSVWMPVEVVVSEPTS